jgi:ankyrin repeat protein
VILSIVHGCAQGGPHTCSDSLSNGAVIDATVKGDLFQVICLIKKGAKTDSRSKNGNTALIWAMKKGSHTDTTHRGQC